MMHTEMHNGGVFEKMKLEMHLTAQQIESVGVESSKEEFEIDFRCILLQGL